MCAFSWLPKEGVNTCLLLSRPLFRPTKPSLLQCRVLAHIPGQHSRRTAETCHGLKLHKLQAFFIYLALLRPSAHLGDTTLPVGVVRRLLPNPLPSVFLPTVTFPLNTIPSMSAPKPSRLSPLICDPNEQQQLKIRHLPI